MGASDAEVEQFYAADVAFGEEEVRGFDVAVHDAARVCGAEGFGDADAEGEGLGDGEGAALEALGEVFAVEPFHGEEELARGGGAVGDVLDDAGVMELGEHVALAGEVAGELGGGGVEDLEGDGRAGDVIEGAIHGRHAACARAPLDRETAAEELERGHRGEGNAGERRA